MDLTWIYNFYLMSINDSDSLPNSRRFELSKKQITVDIYQCDHIDEESSRCDIEGERQSIKQCAMCKMDLCSRHYQMLSVTRSGSTLLSYFFCPKHAEEFIDTLVKTFGDSRPISYAGMAK